MPKGWIFDPFPGKMVVKIWKQKVTDSGLITFRDPINSRIGQVVAVFDTYSFSDLPEKDTEPWVQVGDLVVFGKHSGVEVTIDRDDYIVLRETEGLVRLRRHKEAEDGSVNS